MRRLSSLVGCGKMKMQGIVKLGVQAVAVGVGLFGLSMVCFSVFFAVIGIRNSDCLTFCTAVMFLILGAILITAAWQTLRHFGPAAIRSLVAVTAFFAFCEVCRFLGEHHEATGRPMWDVAIFLLSVLLAVWLYRVVSRILIHLTGAGE
jgi:hypothetical protein